MRSSHKDSFEAQSAKHKAQSAKRRAQSTERKAQSTERKAQSTEHRAQSTEHRAQSTKRRAQSTEHKAQSAEHRAQSAKHRAQSTEHRAQSTKRRAQSQNLSGRSPQAGCFPRKEKSEKLRAQGEKRKAGDARQFSALTYEGHTAPEGRRIAIAVRGLFIILLAAWAGAPKARGQCAPLGTRAGLGETPKVQLLSISLANLSSSHASFDLRLGMRMPRALHLRGLQFSGLRINGLPVFARALPGDWQVPAGQLWSPAQPLRLRLYFRDWMAARSVQSLLAQQAAQVSGRVTFAVIPNFLLQVFVHQVPVAVDFSQTVPVSLPGPGNWWQAGASLLGSAASLLSENLPALEKQWDELSQWGAQLQRQAAPRLVFAYARFTLVHDGESDRFACHGLGWRIDAGRMLLPAELLQPWRYQPDLAAALKTHWAKLAAGSYHLWVWPEGARWRKPDGTLDRETAVALADTGMRLLAAPKPRQKVVYAPDPRGGNGAVRLHVLESRGPRGLALFRLPPNWAGAATLPPSLPASARLPADSSRIAVFRMPLDEGLDRFTPELLYLTAHANAQTIELTDPMDDSAWGSPLFSTAGLSGFLQGPNEGVPWARLGKFFTQAKQR